MPSSNIYKIDFQLSRKDKGFYFSFFVILTVVYFIRISTFKMTVPQDILLLYL